MFALISFAVVRSSIATRLDSFTFDEAYHIGAGAAYVQTGDFRLNPEHPPLVKLWVGTFVSSRGFQLSPYRAYQDKKSEREAVETDVYFKNNPDTVQRHSRAAMFALNSVLLFLFAIACRRVFGDVVALAATAFLVIDPTMASHLPVVMTDLPVALLSATAVLFAVTAFRSWRPIDLILAAVMLGLALSAKHSAVVTMVAVALIGIVTAMLRTDGARVFVRLRRAAAVMAVLIGAIVVLWSFYLFRFSESPATSEEQFNRPLAMKIGDVKSPIYRAGLNLMARGHLFPRAYTWGMADTIRAGAEGRAIPVLAFGSLYYSRAPFYYFPGVIAVKLPVGLLLLTAVGAGLLILRKVPHDWFAPLVAMNGLAVLFFLVLMKGSSYAGIRHALPIVLALALLGSIAIAHAIKSKSYVVRGTVIAATLAALISAIPVMRPWEYYNEAIGGTANAHRYFNDEGIDLSLRTKELVEYYKQHLEPNGEVPYVIYFSPRLEWRSRGLDWVGKEPDRDGAKIFGDTVSGTFIIGAEALAPSLWWDVGKTFRDATPVARIGNLFVFRGTFPAPHAAQAYSLYIRAVYGKIYTAEPDVQGGIEMLSRSVALDPKAFFVALELGNQHLKIGNREEALRAYRLAQENAPASDDIGELLARQIERVQSAPLAQIQLLRNPGLE
ncbi:MAG TPA: phospholipid carrier-dependent glycosyltransferase [Pyrinomonadaceae bacterium]|nr:phospholipid carrier-dependent glycosyltransferase [Pyrinomonadaceae bacterium]